MTAPEVSVVVVNHDGRHYLGDCLAALERQTFPADRRETLLVDNASRDGSVAFVRSCFPGVRVIEAGRNRGFAGGNNLAFAHARGNWIALLNNDAVAEPEWLAALVEAIAQDPAIGTVASKVCFAADPGVINSAGMALFRDGSGGDRGFLARDEGQFDAPAEVFGACGAAMLLRRSLLEDVGGFDERFFMYYEDLDLAWRARLRGWRSVYEPRAVARHVHGGSARVGSPFFVFHVERNRVLANVKNAPPRQVLRVLASFTSRALRSVATRQAGTFARAAASLSWELPGAWRERSRIRRHRTLPDAALASLVAPTPPRGTAPTLPACDAGR